MQAGRLFYENLLSLSVAVVVAVAVAVVAAQELVAFLFGEPVETTTMLPTQISGRAEPDMGGFIAVT